MPDARAHRGPHPDDRALFAPPAHPALQTAVAELSWLLTRGYAMPSALKLVGDRHNLTARQRTALMRAACSDDARATRLARLVPAPAVAGQPLLIDGYNVLTTIEAALAGGVLLACRDTAFRDIASIHGTWRKVEETRPALDLAGQILASLPIDHALWYLDSPVSNSGRLKAEMQAVARDHAWPWTIELVLDPDALLSKTPDTIATADSVILDRCARWFNLARLIVETRLPAAWLVNLETGPGDAGARSAGIRC